MSLLIGIPQKALRFKLMSSESLRSSICADSQPPLVKKDKDTCYLTIISIHISPTKIAPLTSLKANVLVATCCTLLPNSGELCYEHSIDIALI